MVKAILICAIVLLASFASAQDVQVNRDNKTIAVTADDSAEAPPEIAVLKIGYANFAQSKEAAYHDSVLAFASYRGRTAQGEDSGISD